MEEKTHIGQIREQYACNRQSILAALGWDEDRYNNSWIDMGTAYLESQYPSDDPRYAACNLKAKTDRRYWQWWLLEWKKREDKIIHKIKGDPLTASYYEYVMGLMLENLFVDRSFEQNYLRS